MSFVPGAFDTALVLDWSAKASPALGPDSCWLAEGSLATTGAIRTKNVSTRQELMRDVDLRLTRALDEGRRTLVAIDVSFSLPAGAAKVLGLKGKPPWQALWRAITQASSDDEHNHNNRFEVADHLNRFAGVRCFWGRPIASNYDTFTSLPIRDIDIPGLAPNPLPRLRRCELMAGAGVLSNWMLVGKGAVGGQVLTCLPYLQRLRERFEGRLSVWPFSGFGDDGADIVIAETWHGLFEWRSEKATCRDQAQVKGTLRALRQLGEDGRAELFAPPSVLALTARERKILEEEEGWTLGVR